MPARVRFPDISSHTPTRNGELRALAARQRDLVTREQLSALGLGPAAVARRVDAGLLRRVFRGVYTLTQAPLSRETYWLAAVLACGPGASISHYAAGTQLG